MRTRTRPATKISLSFLNVYNFVFASNVVLFDYVPWTALFTTKKKILKENEKNLFRGGSELGPSRVLDPRTNHSATLATDLQCELLITCFARCKLYAEALDFYR